MKKRCEREFLSRVILTALFSTQKKHYVNQPFLDEDEKEMKRLVEKAKR